MQHLKQILNNNGMKSSWAQHTMVAPIETTYREPGEILGINELAQGTASTPNSQVRA